MAATAVAPETSHEACLHPSLLDVRLRGRKDGPFAVPLVSDWSAISSSMPPGNTHSRRMKTMYFDTRNLLAQKFAPPQTWASLGDQSKPPKKLRVEASHCSMYETAYNRPHWEQFKHFRETSLPRPRLDTKPITNQPGRPTMRSALKTIGSKVDDQAFMRWQNPIDFLKDAERCKAPRERPETTVEISRQGPSTSPQALARSKSVVEPLRSPPAASPALPTTTDLLGTLNVSERRAIIKAILLNQWDSDQIALQKIMSPTAKQFTESWLKDVKQKDRDLAKMLFYKLSGDPHINEHDPNVKRIMQTLRGEEGHWHIGKAPHPKYSVGTGENRLKHLNLQKRLDRRDQWSHSTWHHLPVRNFTKKGEHVGSMFQQLAHKEPLEYVLHPELG